MVEGNHDISDYDVPEGLNSFNGVATTMRSAEWWSTS